jgi:hypothetical protein
VGSATCGTKVICWWDLADNARLEGGHPGWFNKLDAYVSVDRLGSLPSFRWAMAESGMSISIPADTSHIVFTLTPSQMVGWYMHVIPWRVLRVLSYVCAGLVLDTFFAALDDVTHRADAVEVYAVVLHRLVRRVHRDLHAIDSGRHMHTRETYAQQWRALYREVSPLLSQHAHILLLLADIDCVLT